MTLSASSCLLVGLSAFALICHVQAGFCDDADRSGYYCRASSTAVESVTRCSCGYKSKKGKLKRECEKQSDSTCSNGCNFARNSDRKGTCYVTQTMCATTAFDDFEYTPAGGTKTTLKETCPAVVASTYKGWANRQKNSDTAEKNYFKEMLALNTDFSKDQLLKKFYGAAAKGKEDIEKAWDANCKAADITELNCFAFFPKCKTAKYTVPDMYSDRADFQGNSYQRDDSLCDVSCSKFKKCVSEVEKACTTANTADATQCIKYSTFGPLDGSTDCNKLCGHQTYGYVDTGSTAASFTAIAIGLIAAFFM